MQNFNEFLIENYGMTEEEYEDMETPLYEDDTKRIIWAEWVRDYLDNNGKGFSNDDAVSIARQLEAQGHEYVSIWKIGSEADAMEQKGE